MTDNKIMVVDDEMPIRGLFLKGFSRAGYCVYLAASAEEAIAMLPETACQVFFLDLYLPDMNGIDLCRRIRDTGPQTICYAVTGYDALSELSEFRQADFDDYFIKPVSLAVLLAAAKSAFAKIESRRLS
jgi:DNA-binding response OmpR family regulator